MESYHVYKQHRELEQLHEQQQEEDADVGAA